MKPREPLFQDGDSVQLKRLRIDIARSRLMLAEVQRRVDMLTKVGLYSRAEESRLLLEDLKLIARGRKPVHY